MTSNLAPKPSFVYFDLGGVVIQDFSAGDKVRSLLIELGIDPTDAPRFRQLWAEHAAPRVCVDYEADEFHSIIEHNFGVKIPDEYSLLQHGFVDRFEPNPGIVKVLGKLAGHVNVGLLTNMYPRMFQAIQAKQGLLPSNVGWDVIIDSSVVGLQKPDKAIFAHATDVAGKPKEEILFIDNTLENLDAAADYGWQTYYYDASDYDRSSKLLGQYLMGIFS